jgi:CMP-N,N'-diacetyllegionaminic acid synthase
VIEGRTVLAVVPARGGSKGVPLKNLRPLRGKSLVAHVGDLVRQLGVFDRAVVSTDHEGIAREAMAHGLDSPFMRPAELAGDRIGDHAVVLHAVEQTEAVDGKHYDVIVMLQPTCPQRRPEHVLGAIDTLIKGGWEAVWTVSPADLKYHPRKALTRGTDGAMDYYDSVGGATVIARQQLTPVYYRNGAAYVVTRQALFSSTSLKAERTGAYVIDEPLLSIDTVDDFQRLEELL